MCWVAEPTSPPKLNSPYKSEKACDLRLEDTGSLLKASGSFAHYHFELYDIDPHFLFALRAVEGKFHKNGIFIYLKIACSKEAITVFFYQIDLHI